MPVVVGVGEISDRPDEPARGLEPAALMAAALRRADEDTDGASLLGRLDSLDVVCSVSWPYADLPARVCELLGHRPARSALGPNGGESPLRLLHEAATRIAEGVSEVAAICGGEAAQTAQHAARAGVLLPWTERDPAWSSPRVRHFLHPLAHRHGLTDPALVYPLYENATVAAWKLRPDEAQAESAALWSAFSSVAARNPYAWIRRPFTPQEIATPSPSNRMIAWPYPKLMVANPTVNQGAAVLVTSLERARAAGIPEDRVVHLWSGAAAMEPRDYLSRDQYHRSHAMAAVLERVLSAAGVDAAALDLVELYSCFPCVPKMARRALGLDPRVVPTVAGGLTFFGAPLNDYMTHATAAMVRRLRERDGAIGLLYGQGEFVTKHHALVVARRPSDGPALSRDYDVQREADARRGPVPTIVDDAAGSATLETYTVVFDRDGAPVRPVAVLRLASGERTMARIGGARSDLDALLFDGGRSPVGARGAVRRGSAGLLEWIPE